MDEAILITELNKILIRERKKKPAPSDDIPPPDFLPDYETDQEAEVVSHGQLIALHERECLRLLIRYGMREDQDQSPMYHYSLSELDEVEFTTPAYKRVFELYKSELEKGNSPDSEFLISNTQKEVVDLLTDRHEVSENWLKKFKIFVPSEEDILDKMFVTNMARLKRSIVQKLLDEHREKLRDVTDPEEVDQLLHVQQELKKAEKELAELLGIVIPK